MNTGLLKCTMHSHRHDQRFPEGITVPAFPEHAGVTMLSLRCLGIVGESYNFKWVALTWLEGIAKALHCLRWTFYLS